jgi:hypothetical protein
MTVGEFVGGLLHAVTISHILHLEQTGPGSYARHMALGDLYEGLQGAVDELAEVYQGAYGLIDGYPASFALPDAEPAAWIAELSRFVQEGRKGMPDDTEIQNLCDEVQGIVNRAQYKIVHLE